MTKYNVTLIKIEPICNGAYYQIGHENANNHTQRKRKKKMEVKDEKERKEERKGQGKCSKDIRPRKNKGHCEFSAF